MVTPSDRVIRSEGNREEKEVERPSELEIQRMWPIKTEKIPVVVGFKTEKLRQRNLY